MPESRARRRVAEIGDLLASELGRLTRELGDHMAAEIVPLQTDDQLLHLLHLSVESNLGAIVHVLRGDVAVDGAVAPNPALEYARRLAIRDVGVTALVRAYRLGQEAMTAWAFEHLGEHESDPEVLLAAGRLFSELTFRYIDSVSEQVVDEYETEKARRQAQRSTMRVAMIEELVAGAPVDLASAEQAIGHRLRQQHVAAVIWCDDTADTNPVAALESAVDHVAAARGVTQTPLFLARERTLAWAWLPAGRGEPPTPREVHLPPGVRVALGRPAPGAAGFATSHAEALRAHRLAVAAGNHARPLTTYESDVVRTASLLISDLDATRRLVRSRLGGLAADTDAAENLRHTLAAFLRHRSSYLATGEQLHLHKNTVKYRIDKAVDELGQPLEQDRLELELALVAADQLGPVVLAG